MHCCTMKLWIGKARGLYIWDQRKMKIIAMYQYSLYDHIPSSNEGDSSGNTRILSVWPERDFRGWQARTVSMLQPPKTGKLYGPIANKSATRFSLVTGYRIINSIYVVLYWRRGIHTPLLTKENLLNNIIYRAYWTINWVTIGFLPTGEKRKQGLLYHRGDGLQVTGLTSVLPGKASDGAYFGGVNGFNCFRTAIWSWQT